MMKRIATMLVLFICIFQFMTTRGIAETSSRTSFENWLEQYGAWDRLEHEYSKESDKDAPDVILKRAEVYLNLNSPQKALELIEMTPAFADSATESQRLWLGGQAHRALGDLSKAVLWFSQAAYSMPDTAMKQQFANEPNLDTLWMDVWLKLYWSYIANGSVSKESQKDTLNRIYKIGQSVWGDSSFWQKANFVLNSSNPGSANPSSTPQLPLITNKESELIAVALAQVSLEKFDDARALISSIQQEPVRFFWTSVIMFLQSGQVPTDLSNFQRDNIFKANAFWGGNILAPYSVSRLGWFLGDPESAPWAKFRNNILSMPVEAADKAINNELGSMLISEQTATLLKNFKFALSMANGDSANSSTAWNSLDKRKLPIALQLAGLVHFKDNLNNVLPANPSDSLKVFPILTALSGAAGYSINNINESPFWLVASQDKINDLSQKEYPMDKLLRLASWQQEFAQKPTIELAKRAAFLFDNTAFGIESLLFLADQAVRANNLQLGALYLNTMQVDSLNTVHKMAWMDIKLRLELDSGRTDTALETFKKMTASRAAVPVMTRLRMALLYQQQRQFDTAREQLLAMWENRASMTTALQAETLFWLGEGEQALQQSDKALDYYLQLAWQYPQENIWALTAMYRASLIYEKRGKYETAKRLLNTVVKQADRKEQREAANARLAAIEKKMGKETNTKNSTLVYPF